MATFFSTSTALTPLGFNASLNSNTIITFRCTIEGTIANWRVNGVSPGAVGVGINAGPALQSGDFIARNLSVPTLKENDNITIECFTLIQNVFSASPSVIFRVQGELNAILASSYYIF